MQGTQDTPAPLRADARRNREQIIKAARALFVSIGPDVPMEEIARSAGVGIGTLYRRFPDRDELIKAVTIDNFSRLVELARRIEQEEPDPAAALTGLLESTIEMRLGIMTAASARGGAIHESPEVAEQRDEVMAVADRLLRRAQENGAIRPDVQIGDVVLASLMVARLAPLSSDDGLTEMVFRRVYALVMDGLRANPGTPLPGRPVDADDITEVRRRGGLAAFGKPVVPSTAETREPEQAR